MCSSIVSTVMGAIIIILYSFLINGDDLPCYGDDCKSRNDLEEFTMAFSVVILALGVTEFVIGI